jgi:predicted dehydrogenase
MLNRLLIIGYGRQGGRYLDVAARLKIAQQLVTVDPWEGTGARTAPEEHFTDLTRALEHSVYDAAIVATPTRTHAEVVAVLLAHSIPTLVEKPIAANLAEAESLVDVMTSTGTPLFVGYVERFNPVVQLLGELLRSGVTGRAVSLAMKRFGVSPSEPPDADVIHDLSVHDIDLIVHMIAEPRLLGAAGCVDHSTGQIHTAQLLLRSKDVIVGVESSRMAMRRERTISILTESAYFVADLIEQHIDIFRNPTHHFDDNELAAFGTISPHVLGVRLVPKSREPLAEEMKAFVASLAGRPDPVLATAHIALASLAIADTASAMIMAADAAG